MFADVLYEWREMILLLTLTSILIVIGYIAIRSDKRKTVTRGTNINQFINNGLKTAVFSGDFDMT